MKVMRRIILFAESYTEIFLSGGKSLENSVNCFCSHRTVFEYLIPKIAPYLRGSV